MTDTISKKDSPPSAATRKKRLVVIVVAALVVALGLGTSAALFGPQLLGFQTATPKPNPAAPPAAAAQAPGKLTDFRNDQAGISLSYPASWVPLNAQDPQVLLIASDGPQDTFLVRSVDLPTAVGQQELPAAKELTDRIVGANKSAKMLTEPKQVEYGGLPGYWYFYTFKDETTGQEGAHSHFFLFKGKTMLTFVFQTLPSTKFKDSAPSFDQIINSFRVLQK